MRLIIICLFISFIDSVAYSKIDIKKRDLCESQKYKTVCKIIIGKSLKGHNTIANFSWDKGKIVGVIEVKRGENISLLDKPDPNYKAKYSGAHLVYKDASGISITSFKGDASLKHLICSNSSSCKKSTDYFKD